MKRPTQALFGIGILIAIALTFQNCGRSSSSETDNEKKSGPAAATELESLRRLIDEINSRDLSCSTSADCTPIPIGSRACGGPSGHLVASENNPDLEQIHALALQTQSLESDLNEDSGLASICSVELPPSTQCVDGKCQAAPPEDL